MTELDLFINDKIYLIVGMVLLAMFRDVIGGMVSGFLIFFGNELNVDDNISQIVDDPIEVAFLNYLAGERFADDSESLENFDVNAELEKFIADKFQGHTVKK